MSTVSNTPKPQAAPSNGVVTKAWCSVIRRNALALDSPSIKETLVLSSEPALICLLPRGEQWDAEVDRFLDAFRFGRDGTGRTEEGAGCWLKRAELGSVGSEKSNEPPSRLASWRKLAGLYALAVGSDLLSAEETAVLIQALKSEAQRCCQQTENKNSFLSLEQLQSGACDSNDVLEYQWRCVEWPLTLAAVLAELDCTRLSRSCLKIARRRLESIVKDWLDTDGVPHACVVPEYGPLVASWARCQRFLLHCEAQLKVDVVNTLEWCVRHLLRSLRPDGTVLGCPVAMRPLTADLASLILELSEDDTDHQLAQLLVGGVKSRTKKSVETDDPSICSEWGLVSVLQSSWKQNASKVLVKLDGDQSILEVARRKALIAGRCTPQLSVNGKELGVVSDLDVICWHSDEDADVLETEAELDGGVIWQRQIVLAREDEFLLIGDSFNLNEPDAQQLNYRCAFPMAEGVRPIAESETNEVYLSTGRISSLWLPLALPEWKAERDAGEVVVDENQVVLEQSIFGRNLWAGWFVDLKPNRSLKPRTWRSLTVAESMRIVPRDVAVAFRVRIGKSQWLIYRSLDQSGNRTFFGENLTDEFFVGRFHPKGMVEPLVTIE